MNKKINPVKKKIYKLSGTYSCGKITRGGDYLRYKESIRSSDRGWGFDKVTEIHTGFRLKLKQK